jgi:hypothetical protein
VLGSKPTGLSPVLIAINKKPGTRPGFLIMAVREGFEPSIGFKPILP